MITNEMTFYKYISEQLQIIMNNTLAHRLLKG